MDDGPVREIDTSTFDEQSSRGRHVEPASTSSAAQSRTGMTNGTVDEGWLFYLSLFWSLGFKHSLDDAHLTVILLVCVSFTIIGQPRNSVLIRRV